MIQQYHRTMRELNQMGAEMRRENSDFIKMVVREAVSFLELTRVDTQKPKKKGRKSRLNMTPMDKRSIKFLFGCGLSVKEIATRFRVSVSTVRKIVY